MKDMPVCNKEPGIVGMSNFERVAQLSISADQQKEDPKADFEEKVDAAILAVYLTRIWNRDELTALSNYIVKLLYSAGMKEEAFVLPHDSVFSLLWKKFNEDEDIRESADALLRRIKEEVDPETFAKKAVPKEDKGKLAREKKALGEYEAACTLYEEALQEAEEKIVQLNKNSQIS